MGTRHRKIDTGNIGHKTQKYRHGPRQKRKTRVKLSTRHRKIDTGNIALKTQKDRHG